MKLPLVGPTYKLDDRTFDTQRCVNLIPEASESGTSKAIARLVGSPGLESFKTAGGGPIRGELVTDGNRCFFVSGTKLYELDTNFTLTERGTLNTAISRVSLAENGTQVMIVDGTNGYILTLATNNFAQIADADFPNGATVVDYIDTYFVVNDPSTGEFYISANNDGTSWAALDKASVESAPDSLVSLLADHGELFLFGSSTVEVYYNSGDATFPFERISQAVMQVGIAAAHTAKSFDNNVVWLGQSKKGGRRVYKISESYRPVRISTKAIEKSLNSVTDISDAYAWVYETDGHEFYCLQVPDLNTTWVYDAATQLWHERMYYNTTLNMEQKHLGSCCAYFEGFLLVGDRDSGNIYKMRDDYYTDNGAAIHRIRITPHLVNELKNIIINFFVLDCQTGVGNDDVENPQVMLRLSRDGGRTYGNERWRSLGKIGKYLPRVKWNRLGRGRDWVFMIKITDAVKVSISGAYIE